MTKNPLFRTYPDLAWSLLCIACGFIFLPHAWFKLSNLEGAYALFGKIGFSAPQMFVWLAILMEAVAAIGLIFNIYRRWAALIGAAVMVGATLGVISLKGGSFVWLWNLGGVEYNVFWTIACIVIALNTPGKAEG